MWYNILLMVGVLGITACAPSSIEFTARQLPCPPSPELPLVMEVELESLSDSAYERLVERELRLAEYIRLLEAHCE